MSRRLPDDVIAAMHSDYQRGLSLAAVARLHARKSGANVRALLASRGLKLRVDPKGMSRKLPNGRVAPLPRLTIEEIDEICDGVTRLAVPSAMRQHWRNWPMFVRRAFVEYLRERLASPGDRPNTPFSSNVEPFDYGHTRACEIAERMNAGRDSRTALTKINLSSQGVIWGGKLWFWGIKTRTYTLGCPWSLERGRPLLSHAIWEQTHQRAVPASHVVVVLDGNKNNLAPENLGLKSRADLAVENKQAAVRKRDRTARFFQMHAGAAALAQPL
jgi:hypothetical protein